MTQGRPEDLGEQVRFALRERRVGPEMPGLDPEPAQVPAGMRDLDVRAPDLVAVLAQLAHERHRQAHGRLRLLERDGRDLLERECDRLWARHHRCEFGWDTALV